MSTLEPISRSIGLFALLSDDDYRILTGMFEVESVAKGQTLYHFGEPGDRFYVVKSGAVELFTRDHGGSKIVLDRCGPDHFFGELALFDGGARSATAVALEDSSLMVLSRDNLIAFLQKHPSAAIHMLTVAGRRLRSTGDQLRRRVTRNANEESSDRRTLSEKAADSIASICGSMPFLLGHMAFFALWLLWNIETVRGSGLNWLGQATFDPFPFGLLCMMVSGEAILLSTCVLISQNRQAAKDRFRSDIEYDVNLKAELEVAHLHEKLDHLHAELLARLNALRKSGSDSTRELTHAEGHRASI